MSDRVVSNTNESPIMNHFVELSDQNVRDSIPKALETIDALAVFAANHGCFTQPVRELIAVTSWLRGLVAEQEGTRE